MTTSISKYLVAINRILNDFHLKNILLNDPYLNEEYIDIDSQSPCLAFSCIFEYTVPLLIAASKLAPKCAFCVLESDWLNIKDNELYLVKGICMDENGQAFLYYNLEKPLLVSYFCNFYIYPSVWTTENRVKFHNLELKSDCPKSSSLLLASFTNDKIYTRILATSKGVLVPEYVAFVFDSKKYESLPNYENQNIIKITKEGISENTFLDHIGTLKSKLAKLVIKPSGRQWMGSKNVFFLEKSNSEGLYKAFVKCLEDLSEDDAILVDEFIDSEIPLAEGNSKLGNRIRVYVSRCSNGNTETTGILCNIGSLDKSISGVSSQSFTLNYLLKLYGFPSNIETDIEKEIKLIGVSILQAIIKQETSINMDTINSQTEFIGLDLILRKTKGEKPFEIFLIEVNDHESISAFASYEILNYPKQSKMLDKWVDAMLHRSYDYLLIKKNILLIDSYGLDKFNVFSLFKDKRMNYMLIDSKDVKVENTEIKCYCYNFEDHESDLEHSKCIAELIKSENFKPDSIITFNSKAFFLVEKIKELVWNNKNQTSTNQSFTQYKNFNFAYEIKAYKFQINDHFDEIDFPLFVKYINGNKVYEKASSKDHLFDIYSNSNKSKVANDGIIDAESYIFGPVFNVTIMVYERVLIFLKLHEYYELAATEVYEEKMNHIKYSIHDLCMKKCLETGIFVCKIIFATQGIKLVSIGKFEEMLEKNMKYFDSCNLDFFKYYLLMSSKIKLMKL